MTVTGSSLRRSTRRFASRLSPPLAKNRAAYKVLNAAQYFRNSVFWTHYLHQTTQTSFGKATHTTFKDNDTALLTHNHPNLVWETHTHHILRKWHRITHTKPPKPRLGRPHTIHIMTMTLHYFHKTTQTSFYCHPRTYLGFMENRGIQWCGTR